MKIIVNPAYEHLRKFVESIPDIFESEGGDLLWKKPHQSDDGG